MAFNSLESLRLHGLRILLLCSLIWTVLIGIGGMMIGNERAAPAMLLSALANILPTWMVMRRRNDLEVRLVMGTLAAVQPAITLFLLSGHVWQMDAHMYFFVALASLAVLYDWRPILLASVLGFSNGASLIMTAFGGTAGVFFIMANLSTVIKRDLSGMGKWLFVGALAIMIGAIINVFVGSPVGMAVIATLAIVVFSMYLLFDLKRIVDGGETNYITATLGLYLSLFNIFQSLLMLLGLFGGDRE